MEKEEYQSRRRSPTIYDSVINIQQPTMRYQSAHERATLPLIDLPCFIQAAAHANTFP